jgi:acyl carrier protein
LYVTGRVKEMIILRGRNLYPQDIEASVRDCIRDSVRSRMGKSDDSAESESLSAEVSFGLAAAFAVSDSRSEALAIIAELPRQAELPDLADLTRAIRRAVMEVHEVDPKHIVLVRSATIPVTTSGKIRRAECKLRFLDDSFAAKHRYDRSGFSEQSPIPFPEFPSDCRTADREAIKKELENWMSDWLVARGGVDPAVLTRDTPLTECGLDSMAAVELSGEVEDWTGVRLTPEVSWNNPSIATLCDYVAETYLANSGKSC